MKISIRGGVLTKGRLGYQIWINKNPGVPKFHPTDESGCSGRQGGKAEETKDGIPPKTTMEWIKEQNEKLKKKKPRTTKKKKRRSNKKKNPRTTKDKLKKPPSCHSAFLTAVPSASNKFSVEMYKEMLKEKTPRDGFLLGLFRKSSGKSSKNLVMSAFSVFTVLSMLRLGAQGETKKQITEALSSPGPRVAK